MVVRADFPHHGSVESPTLPDQAIIDSYIEEDAERLRDLSEEHGATVIRSRAKTLGLTKAFVKKCRLSGTQAALRVCMCCDARFLSWGSQNRLCRRCSSR